VPDDRQELLEQAYPSPQQPSLLDTLAQLHHDYIAPLGSAYPREQSQWAKDHPTLAELGREAPLALMAMRAGAEGYGSTVNHIGEYLRFMNEPPPSRASPAPSANSPLARAPETQAPSASPRSALDEMIARAEATSATRAATSGQRVAPESASTSSSIWYRGTPHQDRLMNWEPVTTEGLRGVYFTSDPKYAAGYGPVRSYNVTGSIKDVRLPELLDVGDEAWDAAHDAELTRAHAEGHAGVRLWEPKTGPKGERGWEEREMILFDPAHAAEILKRAYGGVA